MTVLLYAAVTRAISQIQYGYTIFRPSVPPVLVVQQRLLGHSEVIQRRLVAGIDRAFPAAISQRLGRGRGQGGHGGCGGDGAGVPHPLPAHLHGHGHRPRRRERTQHLAVLMLQKKPGGHYDTAYQSMNSSVFLHATTPTLPLTMSMCTSRDANSRSSV